MKLYNEIRDHVAPRVDLRRKIDSCEAVTGNIIKIIYERLTGIDGNFDAEHERGHSSSSSYIASKRADAVAEMAVKEAEYKIVQEERKQRDVTDRPKGYFCCR